jgi:O-antigen ligase
MMRQGRGPDNIDYFARTMRKSIHILETYVLPLSILAMWAGMLWSRATLSFATLLFIMTALAMGSLRAKWEQYRREPALWGMSILFLIPLLSGLWSTDRQAWLQVMENKLPLLFIPCCIPALRNMRRERTVQLLRIGCGLTIAACIISLSFYARHADDVNASYLRASVMRVAMDNDHVRFAWVLVVQYLFLLNLVLEKKRTLERNDFLAAISTLVFLAVYFHVLASRTGLLGFYMVNILAILKYGKRRTKLALAAILVLIPLLSALLFPSFRNRMRFMAWDYQNYSRGDHTEGLSDAPRVTSIHAGIALVSRHPITGTGFGDLSREIKEWYGVQAPWLKDYERLLPSNEWLLHAAASGLPGAVAFTIAVMLPLFRNRKDLMWVGFHVVAFVGFLYEIGLETQYGVLLYVFVASWMVAQDDRLTPGEAHPWNA